MSALLDKRIKTLFRNSEDEEQTMVATYKHRFAALRGIRCTWYEALLGVFFHDDWSDLSAAGPKISQGYPGADDLQGTYKALQVTNQHRHTYISLSLSNQ